MVQRLGLLVLIVVASPCLAQTYDAGYETLRITDSSRADRPIHLDVWYPTTGREAAEHNYGFSVGRVVVSGVIAGGQLPVVLLSHGAMGAAANYSWLAERLARRGFVVLGVSHFGESPVFGGASVRPEAASRFGERTRDLDAALGFLLGSSRYAAKLDPSRLAAIGHSSGGASLLMLVGAQFSASLLAAYCASAGAGDHGCAYPTDHAAQSPVPSARHLRALVLLDPAVGPGFSESALQRVSVPALVVGSVQNDFLPYAAHAGRIGRGLPSAEVVRLAAGEGHFVYLDECGSDRDALGVPLCEDREGVDRAVVHESLSTTIERFLEDRLDLATSAPGAAGSGRAAAEDEPPYARPADMENLLWQFLAQRSGLDVTSITALKCDATTCEIAYTGTAGGMTVMEPLTMRRWHEFRWLSGSTGTREMAPGAREYVVRFEYQPLQDSSADPQVAARQHALCAAAWRRMTTNPTPDDVAREYLGQAEVHLALARPTLGSAEAERLAQTIGGPVARECFPFLQPSPQ